MQSHMMLFRAELFRPHETIASAVKEIAVSLKSRRRGG